MIIFLFLLAFSFLPSSVYATGSSIYWNASEAMVPPDAPAGATTYYVDGSCTYNGNGTTASCAASAGAAGAWNSIGNALASDRTNANGGVRILIKAGTYKEITYFPQWRTGDEANRKVIAAYGDGEVIIDGGFTVSSGWTQDGSRYYATLTSTPQGVIVDNDQLSYYPATSVAAVDSPGEWYRDSSTNRLYIYPAAGKGSPANYQICLPNNDTYEYATTISSDNTNNQYWYFHGLTIQGGGSHGLYSTSSHLKVELCTLRFNGKTGASFQSYSSNTGQYVDFLKNRVYCNCLHNWPLGAFNCHYGGWAMGLQMQIPNCTFRGNYVYDNHGEGIGAYGISSDSNAIIEDNISLNNWSMNIYVDCAAGPTTIRRNFSYWDSSYTRKRIVSGCIEESVRKKISPSCIGMGDENGSCSSAQSDYQNVYANLFINTRGMWNEAQSTGSNWKYWNFYNNTTIQPNVNPNTYGDDLCQAYCMWGNPTSSNLKNNIAVSQYNHPYAMIHDFATSSVSGLTADYNVYNASTASPFYFNSANRNFAGWKSASGQDANSLFQDPALNNTSYSSTRRTEILALTGIDIRTWAPTVSTPNGTSLSSPYNTDFDENTRTNFTMGAIEYGAGGGDTTAPTTTISTSDPSATTSDSFSVTGTASDAVGVTEVT